MKSKKRWIELSLLAFDKAGNPHKFSDLPLEQEGTRVRGYYPCVYEKDQFLGAIYIKDEQGKSKLLEAEELVHMKSWSWDWQRTNADSDNRKVTMETVNFYLSVDGNTKLVPLYQGECLRDIPWQ